MAVIQIGDKWNLSELAGPPLRVVDRVTGPPTLRAVDAVTSESLPAQNLALAAGPSADEMTQWRLAVGKRSLVIYSSAIIFSNSHPIADAELLAGIVEVRINGFRVQIQPPRSGGYLPAAVTRRLTGA